MAKVFNVQRELQGESDNPADVVEMCEAAGYGAYATCCGQHHVALPATDKRMPWDSIFRHMLDQHGEGKPEEYPEPKAPELPAEGEPPAGPGEQTVTEPSEPLEAGQEKGQDAPKPRKKKTVSEA